MRLTLGVKLTLASTLLVALVVAFLGYVNAVEIRRLHDERASDMQATFSDLANRRAQSTATVLSVSLREALEGTELGTLGSVVRGLVAHDPQVVFALVADRDGRILADSRRAIDAAELPRLDAPVDGLLAASAREDDEDGKRILRVQQPIVVDGEGGEQVARGIVAFGYDLEPLQASLASVETERAERTRKALHSTLLVGAVALSLGVLLSLLQAFRFARPIQRLERTASQIAQGDLGARVRVESNDEVGSLGLQFNHMADRIQTLLVEAVSKAELEHELSLARQIQSVLVPGEGTHTAPGLEVAGYYEPATTCGGDFWDFAALPRGCSALLVGDVTGHGVPAAMLTATAKSCLDTLRHLQGDSLQVSETLRVLDRVIRDAGAGSFFMTATAAILDTHQSTLFFSSAGHPPALLLRWAEDGVKLTRLVSRGNRLGDGDPAGFEARRTKVQSGDLIVWYTDGLIESVGRGGKQYGMRRLLRVLSEFDRAIGPEEAIRHLVTDFDQFRDQVPLEDDVTVVIGRIT